MVMVKSSCFVLLLSEVAPAMTATLVAAVEEPGGPEGGRCIFHHVCLLLQPVLVLLFLEQSQIIYNTFL